MFSRSHLADAAEVEGWNGEPGRSACSSSGHERLMRGRTLSDVAQQTGRWGVDMIAAPFRSKTIEAWRARGVRSLRA